MSLEQCPMSLICAVASAHHCKLMLPLWQVAFQLGYTTVFGWYASLLLLRTGHLAAPVCAHVFCNFMGFPESPAAGGGQYAALLSKLYVVGVVSFAVLLWPLSRPVLFYNVPSDSALDILSAQTRHSV